MSLESQNNQLIEMMQSSIPVIGIALVGSIFAGKLAHKLKVPKVTAYILWGIILGPSFFNLVTTEMADSYNFFNKIAFGLILFNIGGEFNKDLIEKMAWKQVKFSTIFSILIMSTVFLICFAFSSLTVMGMQDRLIVSSFLGIVAIAAAPPTTLLVIKELDAKGPLTQSIMVFLAVGTTFTIIASQLAGIFFEYLGFWSGQVQDTSLALRLLGILWSILGSLSIGLAMGFLLSYWEQREKNQYELLLGVIAAILFGQTLSYYLHIDNLLLSLSLGFSLVNTSSTGVKIHEHIKGMGLTIYSLFFVFAGAHIHLQEQIKSLGIMAFAYIIARTVGIIISSMISAKMTEEDLSFGRDKGLSVLSHAGTALAIVMGLKQYADYSAQSILTIVMTSIFVFELVGPISMRATLIRTGEVFQKKKGRKTSSTSKASITFKQLFTNFVFNLRLVNHSTMDKDSKSIRRLIRRDIIAIKENASLEEVSKFIEKHHADIYPIVNNKHIYKGILSINALKKSVANNLFSSSAKDLIGKTHFLEENVNYGQALEAFTRYGVNVLPIIHPDSHDLIGFLNHKDVVMAIKRSLG